LKQALESQEIYVRRDQRVYLLGDFLRCAVRERGEAWFAGTHSRSVMMPIWEQFGEAATDDCYWELVVLGVFRFLNTDYFTDDGSWNWKSSVDYVGLSARGVALLNVLRAELRRKGE
jgi:hypothetical protein